MKRSGIPLAVIARSGAHTPLLEAGAREEGVFSKETPFGASNPIHMMEFDGVDFALISRHGEKGYEKAAPWVNDRSNLFALKDLGVEKIVSWSSPGSLDPSISGGDLVVPHDVLDETGSSPISFFEGKGIGVIRMDTPFCPGLREAFAAALENDGFAARNGGVYAGTGGPRLETPAETAKLRLLGGTVVGMTVVPEVFLAREIEICYASVCLVVNQAEGLREAPHDPAVLFEGLATEAEFRKVREMEERFPRIIGSLLRAAAGSESKCCCRQALERYRRRGDIGPDWRTWWD